MPKYWPVILAALLAGVALLTGLKSAPAGIEAWNFAARYTARVGFPFLMIAFTASSIAKLWPSPVTKSLSRRRKWWGRLHKSGIYLLWLAFTFAYTAKVVGQPSERVVCLFLLAFALCGWGLRIAASKQEDSRPVKLRL